MRLTSLLLALGIFAAIGGSARAQSSPLDQLTELRLDARSDRATAGYWLLGWGGVSAIGGGVFALVQRHHQAQLAAGITTASFGVINALLSIGLFDLSEARERRILGDREQRDAYARLREEEIVAELHSGQFYAINAGLDVAYIATGVLMYLLGAARTRSDTWEKGVGVAFMSQSAFLLVFDILNWANANARAARLRNLEMWQVPEDASRHSR
jgi:hypothetical protein